MMNRTGSGNTALNDACEANIGTERTPGSSVAERLLRRPERVVKCGAGGGGTAMTVVVEVLLVFTVVCAAPGTVSL